MSSKGQGEFENPDPFPNLTPQELVKWPPVELRGRVQELDTLHAAINDGVDIVVIHGLGGCGKTSLAHVIFEHATRVIGSVGVWVNASDPTSLLAGMLAVAADMGATDEELRGAQRSPQATADLAWGYLNQSEQPWLLVFDNADSPHLLLENQWLRRSSAGTVLVTSRRGDPQWWSGAELIQLGLLPSEQAALILEDLAPESGNHQDAMLLAERLGGLPLALTLAGRYLARQEIEPHTFADYKRHLVTTMNVDHTGSSISDTAVWESSAVELLDQGAGTEGNPRLLVRQTWKLSLDALTNDGSPAAVELLRLLACWSAQPLPVSLLRSTELEDQLSERTVEFILRGLIDHSLTELIEGEIRCLRTHGVLLESTAYATPPDQLQHLTTIATRLLSANLPEMPDRGPLAPEISLLVPHVMALLRHVQQWTTSYSAMDAAAVCALRLITAVHRSGQFAPALALAVEAIDLASSRLGDDNAAIIDLRRRRGRSLFRLGRFEEAEQIHGKLLEHCEQMFGSDAPATLDACLDLASPIANLGRLQEALPLIERAVQGRIRTLGPLHPLSLLARSALVEFSPEAEKAAAAGMALLADCHRKLEEDHSITLNAKLGYAMALRLAGRPQDALPHARAVSSGCERRYGSDYYLTLNARRGLSITLAELGKYEEAILHAEAVVEGRTHLLGPDHPWTKRSKDSLDQYRSAQSQA